MGFPRTLLVLLIHLSFSGLVSGQEEITPNEKAARYHRILQKKPGNTTLFSRFVESWLDTDSKENLRIWIEQSTKDGSPADWQILSSLHDYLGQDEAALRALNNAVKAAPGNAPLRLTRAKLNARLLDFETALLDLKFAADDPRIGTEASKLQGIYLARSGRIEEALLSWEALVEKLPEDEELREDLIEIQVVEGLLQEAAAGAGELVAMTRDPFKKALRHLRLGDLQIMSDDREAGLQTYETIMATTGADTWLEREVLAQVERVFLRDDDVKGLRAFYQKLSEAHPQRISIRKALARQMAANDEIDEAIALFREILKITPGDLGNREEFITFLEASEKWSLARYELMAILKERQDDPSLWERLLRLEITLNNPTGIRSALERIRRIRAQSPEGFIAVANLYQQAELAEDAEKLLREGRKKFPEIEEITEALASLLIENNQEVEALALWQMMAKGANREDLLRISRSLSSHGKQSEAFQLLTSRLGPSGSFDDDPLFLTQLCQLARSEQEAAQAIAPGIKLISLATASTGLENAVRLTRQLILRADQIQKVLATPPVTIGDKCLHASLIAHLGDVPRASRLLEEAATDGPGKLLHFFRIRFEEEFGNTDQAIALLRELLSSPEGKKTVHHRRLVDLLESSGNVEDALKAVGEWKKIAPGYQAAWLRRADLLLANGRPGDAATELRRAIGKFGGDQENLPRLAEALLEDGQTRPAKTIYERLFEESGDLAGKIKWVGKLATVAKRDDTLPSLLADFERRKRAAPNSVAPLLAIAEIHRQNSNQELRRTALLEASRRRPDDLTLRLNIAQEEERYGDFARAASILREALKNDQNNQIKRGLANLHLRMGEIQTGLRLLSGIPGENEDPRNLEKTVITLITSREIRAAAQHLESHLNKHREDWRLQYLHAMLLDLTQESQKSFQAFLSLGHSDGEILGLRPLLGPGGRNPIRSGAKALKGTPTGWDELQHLYSLIRRESSSLLRTLGGRSSQANLITLPGTAREARLMSILHACHLADSLEDDEKKNAAFAKLNLPESPGFPLFLAVRFDINDDLPAQLSEAIEKTPDSLFHLQLWLQHEFDRGADGSDAQRLAAFNRLAKEAPLTAGGILAETSLNGDLVAEQVPAFFESVFDQAPIDKLPDLLANFSDLDNTLDYYGQETVVQVAGVLLKNALRMKEIPKGNHWKAGPLRHVLHERDPEKMITLLNFMGASPDDPNEPAARLISVGGLLPGGGESSLLMPPPFPRTWFGNLPYLMNNALHEQSLFQPNPSEEKRLLLLAQISPAFAGEPVKGPLEFLRGHLHKIEQPLFRDLIAASLSPQEALPEIAAKFAISQDPEQLLFAAGYFFEEGNLAKCFAILKRLHLLPLSRDMRSVCDGHLTHLGALLKSQKADDFDPDLAIKAALRLRRQLFGEERNFLSDHLLALGLPKEARQLNRPSNRSPRPTARSRPSTGTATGRAGIIFHMLHRNKDAAVREGTKTLMAELRSGSSSNVRRTIAVLRSFKLSDEVLAGMTPGAEASRERRVEFSGLTAQMGRKDLALQSYRDLLIDDPNDHESQAVILALTPLKTWQTGKISPEVLSRLSSHLPNDFEKVLTVYELATSHLNSLPPAGGGKRDLRWINQFIKRWHNQSEFESLAIPPLMTRDFPNRSYYDQDATKRRDLAHDRLLRAMVKHPETVRLALKHLVEARKRLGATDDELRDFARKAVIDFGDHSKDFNDDDHFGDPFELPISDTISDYLLDLRDLEFFYSEETLKAIARNQPEAAALITLLRELHHGPDDRALAALHTWEKKIAKDPESTPHRLADLCRLLAKLQPAPGPWSEHFQKLVLAHAATLPDPDSPELFGNWTRYLVVTRGKEFAIDFVEKVFETHLFSRQKWPLYAEISYYHLPKDLKRRLAFCSAIAGNIMRQEEMDASATSLLILLKKTSLTGIFEEANRLLYTSGFDRDDFWNQISGEPEQAARLISQLGLLRPSNPSDLPFFADLLATSHELSRNRDQDWQNKVAHLVRNQKDNHPFLTGVFIAPLLNESERGPLKRKLVTDFPIHVQQCLDHDPRKFGDFFKSPGDHESDPNSLTGKFFAGLEKENHREVLGKVDQWLKDEMPLGDLESEGSSIWRMVRDLSEFDPERANTLVEQAFQKLRLWPKAYQGSIRSGDKLPLTFDAWTSNLSGTLLGNLSSQNIAARMFVYDRLIRGEVMKMSNCPIPVSDSSGPFSSLPEQGSFGIWFSGDDDEILNQLQDVASKLNANQLLSLVLLSTGDGAISNGPASPKPDVFHKKIDEELRPISPILADALMVFELTRNFPDLPENEQSQSLALLQKSRLALLADRTLPVPTRLLFISKLADIDPVKGSLFQDTALAEATLKDFGDYLASPLPPIPSIVGNLIEAFSASSYLATLERAADFLNFCGPILNSAYLSSKELGDIKRVLVTPVFTAGRHDLLREWIKDGSLASQGDIDLILGLSANGMENQVKQFLPAIPSEYYSSSGHFQRDWPARIDHLLTLVPANHRLSLALAIASCPTAPGVRESSRKERLHLLARQAPEQLPKDLAERVRILKELADSPEGSTLLREFLLREIGDLEVRQIAISADEGADRKLTGNLFLIFKQILRNELAEGRTTRTLKQLEDLSISSQSNRGTPYSAATAIIREAFPILVQRAIAQPDQARKLAAFSRQVLDLSFSFDGRMTYLSDQALALVVTTHALADDFPALENHLADPAPLARKMARYRLLQPDHSFLFSRSNLPREFSSLKPHLTNALLCSEWIQKNLAPDGRSLSELLLGNFSTSTELLEAVVKLPDSHPLRATYLETLQKNDF